MDKPEDRFSQKLAPPESLPPIYFENKSTYEKLQALHTQVHNIYEFVSSSSRDNFPYFQKQRMIFHICWAFPPLSSSSLSWFSELSSMPIELFSRFMVDPGAPSPWPYFKSLFLLFRKTSNIQNYSACTNLAHCSSNPPTLSYTLTLVHCCPTSECNTT